MPDYEGYSISHNDNGSITLHYTPVNPGMYRIVVEHEGVICPDFPVCCTVQKVDDDFMTSYETGGDNLLPALSKTELPMAPPVEAVRVAHIDVDAIVASLVSNERMTEGSSTEQAVTKYTVFNDYALDTNALGNHDQALPTSPANKSPRHVPEPKAWKIDAQKAEPDDGAVLKENKTYTAPCAVATDNTTSAANKETETERTAKAGKSAVPKDEVHGWMVVELDESSASNTPPVVNAASNTPPVVNAASITPPVIPTVVKEEENIPEHSVGDEATKKSLTTPAKTRGLKRKSSVPPKQPQNVTDKTDSKKVSLLQKNLNKLKSSINDGGKLSCKIICCGASFESLDKMQQHIRENHQGDDIAATERTSMPCDELLDVPRRKSGRTSKKQKLTADEETVKNKSTGLNLLRGILADVSGNNCPLCEKVLASKQCVRKHIQTMHGKQIGLQESSRPEAVACEVCGKSYFNKYTLQQHVDRMHTKRGAYPCDFQGCTKIFNSPRDLKLHTAIHDGAPNLRSTKSCEICPLCGKQISWGNLKAHIIRKHKSVPGSYACRHPGCLKTFKVLDDLNRHSIVHKDRPQYACDFCEKTFLKGPSLRVHMEAAHQSQDQIPCTVQTCPKVFPTMYKLKVHVHAVHRTKSKVHCSFPNCSAVLGDKRSLRKHEMIHEGFRWVCNEPDCQQVFTQKHSLMRHAQDKHSHDEVVPRFACHHSGCGKKFKFKDLLKSHMNSHVSVRNFHCLVCGKSFKTRGLLNAHSRIHDVDRQYKCHSCDCAFARKYRLRIHIQKTHPGSNPVQILVPSGHYQGEADVEESTVSVVHVNLQDGSEIDG